MATAEGYDRWFDGETTFTPEELRGYRPEAFATRRVDDICHTWRLISKAIDLGETMPSFWATARKGLVECGTWYARRIVVEGIDFEAMTQLPDPTTADGKAFTREAQTFISEAGGAQGWVDSYLAARTEDMIYIVTIGRMCAMNPSKSGWKKTERSLSNRMANAVYKEVTLAEKLQTELSSISSPNKKASISVE